MEIMASRGHTFIRKRSPSSYRDQIYSLVGLPTLPTIAFEIQNTLNNDRLSVSQIVPIIDKDPPLAMKLLKMANSSYYGMREKVESLRQAIIVIGLNDVSSLATGFSVIKAFRQSSNSDQIGWSRFWEHSSATGHIGEILNSELNLQIETSPYSIGLLHDIGKLVLHRIDPKGLMDSMNVAKSKQCPSYIAEMEMLGITHMDAGMWIAQKWQLPKVIQYAIGYHHAPSRTPDSDFVNMTAFIQLADYMAVHKGISFSEQYPISDPGKLEGWLILTDLYNHLNWYNIKELMTVLDDQFGVIEEMVHIFE